MPTQTLSNHISPSSTNPSARTAPIRPPTSITTKRNTNTAAVPGGCAKALSAGHLEGATGVRDGRFQEILRQETGLCCLRPEASTHTQPGDAQFLPVTPCERARQKARDIATTDAFGASGYARKKVEMLFAHLRRILGLGRLRLRGPNGTKDEFRIAATVQNLRKLAKLRPLPARKRGQPLSHIHSA